MRCCAWRLVASISLLAIVLFSVPARAALNSRWAGGAQFAVVSTHFAPGVESSFSYGLQGGVLRRISPYVWLGIEAGHYEHGQPFAGGSADFTSPDPLNGVVSSDRLTLAGHVGPRWAFRPYAAVGLGISRVTSAVPYERDFRETAWTLELGTGVRGGDKLLPWLEWRWHRSLSPVAILGGRPLDYHTMGVGVGWN